MIPTRIVYLSELKAHDEERCSFAEASPASLETPLTPSFMFGDLPAAVLRTFYAQYGLPHVGVWSVRDIDVSDAYLVSSGEVAYCDNATNIHPAYVESLLKARAAQGGKRSRRRIANRCAMLCGPGYSIYGHWLVDLLPKLYLLHVLGFKLESLVYLLPSNVPKFALNWLELLGIRADQLLHYDNAVDDLQVEELLIPTVLHNGVRMSPLFAAAANMMIDRIETGHGPLPPSSHGHRLLLSRGRASQSRRLLNRDAIEAMALNGGFSLVHPQLLPLVEQVSMFRGARVVVGEYGSALHGTMFSREGTVVCALRGSRFHPAFIQSGMGRVLRQPTGYIFGQSMPDDPSESFTILEEDFRACLRHALGGIRLESALPSNERTAETRPTHDRSKSARPVRPPD